MELKNVSLFYITDTHIHKTKICLLVMNLFYSRARFLWDLTRNVVFLNTSVFCAHQKENKVEMVKASRNLFTSWHRWLRAAGSCDFFFFLLFIFWNKIKQKKKQKNQKHHSCGESVLSPNTLLPLYEDAHGAAAHSWQKEALSLAAVGSDCVLARILWRKRENEREFPGGSGL